MKLPTKWDLSELGSSLDDPRFIKERARIKRAHKAFEKKWKDTNDYTKKASVLREALDDYERLARIGGAEGLYLFFRSSLNSSDTKIQAAMARYRDVINDVSDHIRFFELSLGKISQPQQKKLLKAPTLTPYHNYLKGIFDASRYLLSEKEERILDMKSSVSSGNWVNMLEEFLYAETRKVPIETAKGKKVVTREQTLDELLKLSRSKNQEVSEKATEAIQDILLQHKNVAEKELNSFLENKKIDDELRGVKRPDSIRHLSEGIETTAVDSLLKVVSDNFKLSRDYYQFKAKLVGVKKFTYWNRLQEYGAITQEYPYKKSVDIVNRALSRIHPEFSDIFKSFINGGQIDVYPKKGKRGGAFCASEYDFKVRIFLNHKNNFRDVSTLAHEMGHGIHAVKASIENTLNYHPPTCTAEVASTFCEDFVIEEVIKDADDESRLNIMLNHLEDKMATIFRQVAAYSFEYELHETYRKSGYLTEKEIGKIFNKHMRSYLGPRVTLDEHSGRGWMYWSHFRSPFYVYSYAMALLVSQAVNKRFKDNPEYMKQIQDFYSTGSSLSPKEIYANLGMDINSEALWQEGINEVKSLFSETKKLARKLGKIS